MQIVSGFFYKCIFLVISICNMKESRFKIREARLEDFLEIKKLYQTVSKIVGGIARTEEEITDSYIHKNLENSLSNGISLVIEEISTNTLVGEIHCYKLDPKVFNHVLSELTIVVHPNYQGNGVGKKLFVELLSTIENKKPDVLRVELIARESNKRAIAFYESIGFVVEGRFEKRIMNVDGTFEADIPMAWMNKNYKALR